MTTIAATEAATQIRKWVRDEGRRTDGDAADDADLMEDGYLDSLGLMSMIGYVEELRGRMMADEEMRMENFTSIKRIVKVFFTPAKSSGPAFGR